MWLHRRSSWDRMTESSTPTLLTTISYLTQLQLAQIHNTNYIIMRADRLKLESK